MNTSKLLAAIDFSKATDAVLEEAAVLAKALDAKLWVLHVTSDESQAMVYEPGQFVGYAPEFIPATSDVQLARDLVANEIKREHAHLHAITSTLRDDGVDATAILLKGDAARLIVEKAKDLEAGIVILGSHGHGLLRKALLGSVSEAVMHRAACNVLIVPMAEE